MNRIADSLGVLGEALGLLGGLLGFLGATGIVLFLLSLILMGLVGAFSPLPKMLNYVAVVSFVTLVALFGVEEFGELPGRVAAIREYLIVMLAPVVAIFLLRGLLTLVFGRRGLSETRQLREAVTELTEQVAALRREQRPLERREAAALTLDAMPRQPRLLRRIDG
ncbi:MAG: hypothetical protein V2I43_23330 [Parvularcula sp.]|jgi:hypothetical protein|nr:hypothetical protein [Parvularcula sp.]